MPLTFRHFNFLFLPFLINILFSQDLIVTFDCPDEVEVGSENNQMTISMENSNNIADVLLEFDIISEIEIDFYACNSYDDASYMCVAGQSVNHVTILFGSWGAGLPIPPGDGPLLTMYFNVSNDNGNVDFEFTNAIITDSFTNEILETDYSDTCTFSVVEPDPQIGDECILDNGEIGFLDCELCCWDIGLLAWLGDEWCDDMGGCTWEGPQYDCPELGYDCGDCNDEWDGDDPSGFCEGNLISCEDQGIITCPDGDCAGDISYCTENCDEGYVEDCHDENDCLLEDWIGDGYPDCWPGTMWDLACYNNDGGDCDGYTTCEMQGLISCPNGECVESLDDCSDSTECVDGYVSDCSGDGDCCWDNWIGDGWADCSDQQYGCDLTCYDCDGGDCLSDDPGCVDVYDCSILYDTNNDGVVNILDVIEVVNYILNGDNLLCPINDDGVINVLDIVLMVNIILEGDE